MKDLLLQAIRAAVIRPLAIILGCLWALVAGWSYSIGQDWQFSAFAALFSLAAANLDRGR